MEKKTILVTGASSGIGKGIASYFLANGYNVVINSTTKEKLEKVYQELGGGENIEMVVGDIGLKETGQKMVDIAMEKFGSVDILVNNAQQFGSAAAPVIQPLEDYDERTGI